MAALGIAGDHTCPVCLELFNEPKVLPCCHTFCLKYLEKTARSGQKKGEIVCPQCRKTHAIPAGGLTEFLTDFIASHEIEVASLTSSKSCKGVKTLICGECDEDKPLESYCNDCQNYLCHGCSSQIHKRGKAYRGHTVVSLENIGVTTFQPCHVRYCATHKGEALTLYCGTCTELICRDCALVAHRQHEFEFVSDARKQIDADMESLMSEVNEKLDLIKHNLEQIKKVEISATGHEEVLKADVNTFFDELVRSLEARRVLLLSQVESQCQKDMKQIWADKNFHEIFLSQISSVFGLADKARKCTSDVEMILTALQSIEQLTHLQNKDWDDLAFVNVVLSTPKFSQGEQVTMDAVGVLGSSSTSPSVIQLSRTPKWASLGSSMDFSVYVTIPVTQELIDERSGLPVDLLHTGRNLSVHVHYGNSGKELDNAHVSIVKAVKRTGSKTPRKKPCTTKSCTKLQRGFRDHGVYVMGAKAKQSAVVQDEYRVTIGLVCGGYHTVTFVARGADLKHTFTVTGYPSHGELVKKGPDWKPRQRYSMAPFTNLSITEDTDTMDDQSDQDSGSELPESDSEGSDNEIGTVVDDSDDDNVHVVSVREHSAVMKYKWGQDGLYEVELVDVYA